MIFSPHIFEFIASPYFWGALGIVLIISEMFVPGAVLLFLGLSALITCILSLILPLQATYLLLAFAIFSLIFLVLVRKVYIQNILRPNTHNALNQRGKNLVGTAHTLEKETLNKKGHLHIGDSMWAMRLCDAENDLPAGTQVRITDIQGTLLIAKKA